MGAMFGRSGSWISLKAPAPLTLRRKTKGPDNQWNRNGVVYLEQRFVENMVNGEHGNAEADCDLGRSCAS